MRVITIEEAKDIVQSAHPELTITNCWDYDNEHFVVEAVHDTSKMELDPYYGVTKSTGEVNGFSPAGNLMKFLQVINSTKKTDSENLHHAIDFVYDEIYARE